MNSCLTASRLDTLDATKGDLTIQLIPVSEASLQIREHQPVPVPGDLDTTDPVVAGLLERAESMHVSESSREPAPLIVAAAAAKPGQFYKKADRGVVRKAKTYEN